jgi:hypothetical protein
VDAVTNKPETGSTLTLVTTPMKQVATVQSGLANVYLESQAFNTIIENDLRLALNEGLDKLILDAIAGSGFQAPGTDPLLVSIRKAVTTIQGNGYSPDTLILTPANAEALDVLVSGITGGVNDYTFGPGQFAPGTDLRAEQAHLEDDPRRSGGRQHGAREDVREPREPGPLRGERRQDEHVARAARDARRVRRRASDRRRAHRRLLILRIWTHAAPVDRQSSRAHPILSGAPLGSNRAGGRLVPIAVPNCPDVPSQPRVVDQGPVGTAQSPSHFVPGLCAARRIALWVEGLHASLQTL